MLLWLKLYTLLQKIENKNPLSVYSDSGLIISNYIYFISAGNSAEMLLSDSILLSEYTEFLFDSLTTRPKAIASGRKQTKALL
jgi:hypothetical protein